MIRNGTRKFLDGTSIKIEESLPEYLIEEGITEWYMAQPDPELYNDGEMKYHAKRLLALEDPDIKALSKMPPSDDWKESQRAAIAALQAQVDELVAKRDKAVDQWISEHEDDEEESMPPKIVGLTPEEAYELSRLSAWVESTKEHVRTAHKATELVNARAAEARAAYMIPWMVVDKNGELVFDMETEAGQRRWQRLNVYKRAALRGYYADVLSLVILAKN